MIAILVNFDDVNKFFLKMWLYQISLLHSALTESFSSHQFLKSLSGSLQLDFTWLNFTLFTVVVPLHLQRLEEVRFTFYTHAEVKLKSLMSKSSLTRSRWRSLGNYVTVLFFYLVSLLGQMCSFFILSEYIVLVRLCIIRFLI